MKNYVLIGFIALFLLDFKAFAQKETLVELLEKTILLSENEKTTELKDAIGDASFAVESEAYTRGNEMKNRILKEAKVLKSFIPLVEDGTLKKDSLNKVVNTIRLLIGVNQINNLLGEGKEGLIGNAETISTSISLLQKGKVILDNGKQQKLSDLLADVSKIVSELDSKEANAKGAASSAKKTLGKIVYLLKETI
ncbi:hypothetical protein [Emticicia agri]|uniref:Uncharacterized protein n=1 Tax=Emticicia agri TaxID=2492393 RepID=A0A4Q5LVQ5_9BACT|nr:hypothetical protein [Emticicia agri]RYU93744.1 hypothetical protein EWM59_20250 [Emticicia agri]